MEYLIRLILSLSVAGLARVVGFDRDSAFYPTVLIVVGFLSLFAAMGASGRILLMESLLKYAGCRRFQRAGLWSQVRLGAGSEYRPSLLHRKRWRATLVAGFLRVIRRDHGSCIGRACCCDVLISQEISN